MIDREEVERVAKWFDRDYEMNGSGVSKQAAALLREQDTELAFSPWRLIDNSSDEARTWQCQYCKAIVSRSTYPSPYGHAATCQHSIQSVVDKAERAEKAEAERDEQARLNGMGGEREARLMAKIAQLEKEYLYLEEERDWEEQQLGKIKAERDEAFAEIARLVDQCRAVDQLRVEANALWAEELDKAIKYGKAMAKDLDSWDDDRGGPNENATAFRKWMEERGK